MAAVPNDENRRALSPAGERALGLLRESCGAVLMGGKAKRMGGVSKAFLQAGGQRFLDRIVCQMQDFGVLLYAVGEALSPELPREAQVIDRYAGIGPMGGLCSVLERAETELVFVVPCDMPLLRRELILALFEAWDEGADCVVPVLRGQYEPLCAIYGKSVLPRLHGLIARGTYKISALYKDLRVKTLTVGPALEDCFININTPEEYDRLHLAKSLFFGEK